MLTNFDNNHDNNHSDDDTDPDVQFYSNIFAVMAVSVLYIVLIGLFVHSAGWFAFWMISCMVAVIGYAFEHWDFHRLCQMGWCKLTALMAVTGLVDIELILMFLAMLANKNWLLIVSGIVVMIGAIMSGWLILKYVKEKGWFNRLYFVFCSPIMVLVGLILFGVGCIG